MYEEIINIFDTEISTFSDSSIHSGKTGSGKTTAGCFELENEFLFRKTKCIDFDSSGRFENCSYSLPETNPELINRMGNFPDLQLNWKLKPMSFKDEVFLFCGRNLDSFPRLPKNFKVVSYKLEDLDLDVVTVLLGDTPALLPFLNKFQSKFGLDINIQDIWDVLFKKEFRGDRATIKADSKQREMIKVRIQGLIQTGLFSTSEKVKKIDFIESLNDIKKITCFNSILQYTGKEEELAYAITLNKIFKLMSQRKLNYRVFLYIREIHDYIHWKMCLKPINQILRKGRTLGKASIAFSCDTQRPVDLPPILRRQLMMFHQLRGDDADAKKMLEIQFIPPHDLSRITKFDVGYGMLLTGNRYDVPLEYPSTRHKHPGPNDDIIKLLIKTHGYKTYNIHKILQEDKKLIEEMKVEMGVEQVGTEYAT